jgi:hypothetical protein
MAQECARQDLLEMMLLALFSLPLLDVLVIRE